MLVITGSTRPVLVMEYWSLKPDIGLLSRGRRFESCRARQPSLA
jgi:hypothetical protein